MPLPFPVRVILALYKYLEPYIGKDSAFKKWIVKNKVLAILIGFMIIQLFIIVLSVDQLLESNKQIVNRDNVIAELKQGNEYLVDKNKVLTTVIERAIKGPLDGLKSTEAIPLPESEIKTPVDSPFEPSKPPKNDTYIDASLYVDRYNTASKEEL